MEIQKLPTKVATDATPERKGATQEDRALAVLTAAAGELVPWEDVVRAVYPQAGDNLKPHRAPLRDVLRRLRERGISIQTVPHRGFALKGPVPETVVAGEAGRSKPAPQRDTVGLHQCKPGCGKWFKREGAWNRRCPDCHQKARDWNSSITVDVW
jgi:hypothetical protein